MPYVKANRGAAAPNAQMIEREKHIDAIPDVSSVDPELGIAIVAGSKMHYLSLTTFVTSRIVAACHWPSFLSHFLRRKCSKFSSER